MLTWDVATLICLAFTATVTPYEIALLDLKIDELFWANRIVDVTFTIDIVINFMLMYHESPLKGGRMVKDHTKIRHVSRWSVLTVASF